MTSFYANSADLVGSIINQCFTKQVDFCVQPVIDEDLCEELDAVLRCAKRAANLGIHAQWWCGVRADVLHSEDGLGNEGMKHVSTATESTTGCSISSSAVSSDTATAPVPP